MLKKILPIALSLVLVASIQAQGDAQTPTELCRTAFPAEEPDTRSYQQPEQVLEDGVDYYAIFCTSAGAIYVDLFETETPETVNNFVFLAQEGYYNNTNFHRVIQEFMAQAGDPTNTGTGGPGYQFADEILDDLTFDRAGLLAMANAGPGTNGSQFFITTAATDWLNGAHTIFGEVVTGYDNVLNIRLRDPQQALLAGTRLDTILIVEDTASIDTSEPTLEPATQADFEAAFETLSDLLPSSLDRAFPQLTEIMVFQEDASQVLSADERTEAAGGTALFETHGLEFSATTQVLNEVCDLESFPIASMDFIVDAYPSVEDATAALEDPTLADLQTADGFELLVPAPQGLAGYEIYTQLDASQCGRDDLFAGRGIYQVGRYVITSEIIVTPERANIGPALIDQFAVPLFEDSLWTVIAPEIS